MSQAIVTPNEPAPGDSFNQGSSCFVAWDGDVDSGSTTAWKGMAIELMTGPNEAMIHVTTVAQDQDGTVAGSFNYTCPEVTPNSPIYFYQFSAPGTGNFTWTGRFTIAAADGTSTPATETEQSNGQTVAWGKGALIDPSTAVAAPNFGSSSASAGASTGASAGGLSSPPPSSSASKTAGSTKASTSASVTGSSAPSGSGTTGAAQSTGSSAALAAGPMALNTRMWPFAAAITVSAMAFTLLL
ncbi:hypothetical protein FB451DRAFT_1045197 [Mycena latifolia]|nr:hypothetical protein FB451DRAFT_1045197 [Mycena latifolia]